MTDGRASGRSLLSSGVLVVVLVVAMVSGGGIAVAQDGGVPGGPDPTARFNQSTVAEERGDIATMELRLTDTNTARVTVGSPSSNYETAVRVVDNDNDGRVFLRLNTYTAGRGETEAGVYDAAGEDTVTSVNRTTRRLDEPLETSQYNLSIAAGDNRTGTPDDTPEGTLDLGPRSTDDLVTWTAPAATFDDVANASEVARAVDRGEITTTDTIAAGDVLVNQIEVSGIYGALAASNLSQLLAADVLDLRVHQTNPGTNRRPKRVNVSASLENDSIGVIADPANDALYVNVHTGAATVEGGSIAAGDEYAVTVAVNESSGLTEETQSLTANVSIASPELGLGDVALAAAANQTVGGTTLIAPGSAVRVTVTDAGNGSFSRSANTTVGSNGSFAAEFNLSTVATNTTVSVSASGPLNTSDEVEVAVGSLPTTDEPTPPARLVFTDQTTRGETVAVANATLPEGGFVTVHRADGANGSGPLGVSAYLESGTHSDVRIGLDDPLDANTTLTAVARTDGNDDGTYDANATDIDPPYTTNGEDVSASATVRVVGGTTSAAATTDTPGSTTAAPSTTDTPGPTTALGTTTDVTDATNATATTAPADDPGTGIDPLSAAIGGFVGVLVVILLIGAVVLWRR